MQQAFPGMEPPPPAVKLTADQRRAKYVADTLAAGRHPANRQPLAGNGETCGTCQHCAAHDHRASRYYKCDLIVPTHGAATDIRLKWPACVKWEPDGMDGGHWIAPADFGAAMKRRNRR